MSDEPKPTIENPDPFVAGIMESMQRVVDPAATETPDIMPSTISDVVAMRLSKPEESAGKNGDGKNGENAESGAGAEGARPAEKTADGAASAAATEKPAETQAQTAQPQPTVIRVVKKEQPAPPPEDPKVKEQREADEQRKREEQEFVDGLTEQQKEELALAQFAEGKGKKGAYASTIEYYRKLDAALQEHPDWNADSEELAAWIKENQVKWTPGERQKIERDMIRDQATRDAVEITRREREQKDREILEAVESPKIEARVQQTITRLTTPDEKDKNTATIPPEAVKVLREKGYEEAEKLFSEEAPIIQGAINSVTAWERLASGVDKFNREDPVHQYIAQVLRSEYETMAKSPETVRVVGGKEFLPIPQYQAIVQQNPEARNKYWTFTRGMVSDRLESAALQAYNERIRRLRAAGWTRDVKVSDKTETTPDPNRQTARQQSGRPEATTSSIPGADVSEPTRPEHAEFLDKIFPGASALIAK